MCIEDIRLGRKTYFLRYRVTVPAGGSIQAIAYNPDRVHLTFPNIGTIGPIAVDVVDMAGTTDGSYNLQYKGLDLDIKLHGMLTTSSWFASNSSGAPITITVIETVLREQ